MVAKNKGKAGSAVFITFPGNCKEALSFYRSCFGGTLRLEPFETAIKPYKEIPIVSGILVADSITIHGSDLVHNEGRKVGNYMAVFIDCKNAADRKKLLDKLVSDKKQLSITNQKTYQLIEITDVFDVRWVLGVNNLQ